MQRIIYPSTLLPEFSRTLCQWQSLFIVWLVKHLYKLKVSCVPFFVCVWCNDRHSSAACFFPYNYLLSLYFIYVQLQIIQLDTLVVIFSIFYWWYLPYVCVSVMSISHRLLYPIALCVQLRYCPSYTYFFNSPLIIFWKSFGKAKLRYIQLQ